MTREISNYRRKASGFTLIEMVVATGIFIIFTTLLAGIFSQFTATQKRDTATQTILEQMRLTLEVMNREVRTGFGSTYTLTDNSGQSLSFRNQNGLCVFYRLREGVFERAEADLFETDCPTDAVPPQAYAELITGDINITQLRFDAVQTRVRNGSLRNQGFVTLMLQVESSKASGPPIKLQSTVTSRQTTAYIPING